MSDNDKKILEELNQVVAQVSAYLEKFDFNHAADAAYHYFWHTFCDKIIEEQKKRLGVGAPSVADRRAAQYLLFTILTTSLKLLHPFMPFVTEAVWQKIPREKPSMLISESWPKT